jgi:chromosomal replication initiator protein
MNYWTQPLMKEKSGLKAQIEKAEIIIAKVATFYGMANKDIRGKCRQRELVKARWIAMYFIRQQTDFTLKTIGDMFGRDHTTVIHAIRMFQQDREVNEQYELTYHQIKQKLELRKGTELQK